MRRAYTIIEVLIAVALGTAVCLVAYAGLRAAASTSTAANRLAIENQMLRAGIHAVIDELDTWRSYNDPDDPRSGVLHHPSPDPSADAAHSLPFNDLIWDADFDQSDPRAWWRGFGVHADGAAMGDYAAFARLAHPDPWRAYLPETAEAVNLALGHYALIDLMPANTIFHWRRADGSVDPEFSVAPPPGAPPADDASAEPRFYTDWEMPPATPRDIYASRATEFAVTTDADYVARAVHRSHFMDFYPPGSGWHPRHLHDECAQEPMILPLAPAHWPRPSLSVRRFIFEMRYHNLASVAIVSPLTGQRFKLQFNATATTLRGARRQRDRLLLARGLPPLDREP